MSYVLDALRRAEAERARGDLPGLHAQPVATAPPALAPEPAGRDRVIAWAALAVIMVVGVVAALAWWRPADAPAPPSAVPAARTADAAPPAQAAPPAPATPSTSSTPATPADATAEAMRTPAVAPSLAPSPLRVPPRPVERELPSTASTSTSTSTPPPSTPAASPTPAPVPTLAQLPAAARQGLPPLAFGGATYSSVPSARMLLINGQLYREGDEVAPGLRLEHIRLRSAQMRWRDQPFEVGY